MVFTGGGRFGRPVVFGLLLALCCAGASKPAPSAMRTIPAGSFSMGSLPAEREYGYRLDETLHNSTVARRNGWFEVETRKTVELSAYQIDAAPVTNAAYLDFVQQTQHRQPFVTEACGAATA